MSTELHSDFQPAAIQTWWPNPALPRLISGPCSAETEAQVLETARRIKVQGKAQYLRAGIWKPRTRPNSFEGVGEIGLEWMQAARAETGLPITTEVATAAHVEACLKHGFDMLWIGARTTVNPFSVQEIADALQGVDIPVLVKNPINPDLQLWIGALERIYNAGIRKLAAVHRGFSYYGKSIYRNKPMWEIPIALKAHFENLPIICDPSHISGRRDLLQPVAQKALDLGMDGLMLESHITPDEAWSDAKQQITPEKLTELIDALNVRSVVLDDPAFANELHALRSRIDKIDEEIIQLLGQRLQVTREIGLYKKDHHITVLQLERWKEIVQSRTAWAKELGLTDEFIERFLEQLHKESIRNQTWLMNNGMKPTNES
jgi:chorismate mutase